MFVRFLGGGTEQVCIRCQQKASSLSTLGDEGAGSLENTLLLYWRHRLLYAILSYPIISTAEQKKISLELAPDVIGNLWPNQHFPNFVSFNQSCQLWLPFMFYHSKKEEGPPGLMRVEKQGKSKKCMQVTSTPWVKIQLMETIMIQDFSTKHK